MVVQSLFSLLRDSTVMVLGLTANLAYGVVAALHVAAVARIHTQHEAQDYALRFVHSQQL
jgi:hypothetical protein